MSMSFSPAFRVGLVSVLLPLLFWPGHFASAGDSRASGVEDRAYLVSVLDRVARPVLEALSKNELGSHLPVRSWDKHRRYCATL